MGNKGIPPLNEKIFLCHEYIPAVITMEYQGDLNPEQQEAVMYLDGPLLILAGAGSGKTRVITHKIVHIVNSGFARPDEIMAVTFTNKAADEMKSRIRDMLPGVRFPSIGTFHSFCADFLRRHGTGRKESNAFVIYDQGDRRVVLRECIKELNIDEKRFSPEKAGAVISRLKNKLLAAESFSKQCVDYDSRIVSDIYLLYEQKMNTYNALDFDDLLMKSVFMLQSSEELKKRLNARFRYFLVDEYQDVNQAQYVLLLELASQNRNITVVGDDDQSIYGFRGAEIEILLRFEEDFNDAKVIKLEQNYRSTRVILDAANNLMKSNINRKEKNLWTEKHGDGQPIWYYKASDGRAEARFVANKIREFVRNGLFNYRDMAVIYRTNAQSRPFEEAFIQEAIPYNLIGSLKFYDRKEVKDLLAYLKVIINPEDSVSFRRIVNVPPRGIGEVTIGRLEEISRRQQTGLFSAAAVYASSREAASRARSSLNELLGLINEARSRLGEMTAAEVLKALVEKSGYRAFIVSGGRAEDIAREENIDELFNVIKEFEVFAENNTPEAFLQHVSLISDIDLWNEQEGKGDLMTFHLTKGLKFPVVFMTGLEEKYLPHSMSMEQHTDIEEERRLCYVGITRAMERLFFTHAETRFNRGFSEPRTLSRFLMDIPPDLLYDPSAERLRGAYSEGLNARASTVLKTAPPGVVYEPLHEGDMVIHRDFGTGTVLAVSRNTVRVDFKEKGIKTIVRDFLSRDKHYVSIKKQQFEKGDRVSHERFGSGIVCLEDGGKDWALVIFPRTGSQKVKVSELKKIIQNIPGEGECRR